MERRAVARNYAKAWAAQLKTPWGQQHLDRVALVDGPHVLSSAKRYDLSLRIDGRIRRVLGIGAVFTAPAHRGRGCARELLARMLDTAVTEGQEFAMLFSEIAPAFYERLDFVPVPLLESTLEVDQKRGGAPAMLVRSGDEQRPAGDRRDERGAIGRTRGWRSIAARILIRFRSRRKRLQSGLAPSGYRNTEFLVVEEGHQAVAYLVSTEQDGRWMIEECRRSRSVRRAARRDAAGDAGAASERAAARDQGLVAARRSCRRR